MRDQHGNKVEMHDLQNKGFWCEHGLSKELVFVEKIGCKMGVILNPEKEMSPYVPDLLQTHNNQIADLKTQNTPLFQAQERYGIPPQFAVTFNLKDYERYSRLYKDIAIFFCVEWLATSFTSSAGKQTSVQPMKGVWWTELARIHELIKAAPIHSYRQRVNDTKGNAKASYVFDLRDPHFFKIV